jgi:hypothetical protein
MAPYRLWWGKGTGRELNVDLISGDLSLQTIISKKAASINTKRQSFWDDFI